MSLETLPCPWHPGEWHRALDLCTPGVVLPVGGERGLPRYSCTGGMHTEKLGDAICTCTCHRVAEAPPVEPSVETPLSPELLAVLADPTVALPGDEAATRLVLRAAAEGRVSMTPRSARATLAMLDRLTAERDAAISNAAAAELAQGAVEEVQEELAAELAAERDARAAAAAREKRLRALLLRSQAYGCLPHTRECPWQHSEKREAQALAEDCNCGVAAALAHPADDSALRAALAEARREVARRCVEANGDRVCEL